MKRIMIITFVYSADLLGMKEIDIGGTDGTKCNLYLLPWTNEFEKVVSGSLYA